MARVKVGPYVASADVRCPDHAAPAESAAAAGTAPHDATPDPAPSPRRRRRKT